MEIAKTILIPINADPVLDPCVHYGAPVTAIYFTTEEDNFGRITFEALDSIKISRGELMPYENNGSDGETYSWIYKIENSKWQIERYQYEKDIYGSSYEFGGSADEMLTEFRHYLFSFHDQFVEAISKGFWFEESNKDLYGKDLSVGHPFLPIPEINVINISLHNLICKVRINPVSVDELKANANYCSQKLMEFLLELEGRNSVTHTLVLSKRNEKFISTLRDYFGKKVMELAGIATLDDVRLPIETYLNEVFERRKAIGK
jgi:hypothetical protein